MSLGKLLRNVLASDCVLCIGDFSSLVGTSIALRGLGLVEKISLNERLFDLLLSLLFKPSTLSDIVPCDLSSFSTPFVRPNNLSLSEGLRSNWNSSRACESSAGYDFDFLVTEGDSAFGSSAIVSLTPIARSPVRLVGCSGSLGVDVGGGCCGLVSWMPRFNPKLLFLVREKRRLLSKGLV